MAEHGAFIWYELMTPDPAGARDFYKAVVGWDIAGDGMPLPNGGEYRMINRYDGKPAGGVLTLTSGMAEAGMQAGWFGYIHHPDIDEAVRVITESGGQAHIPPMDMEGVGRMAMVSDPQGAMLYIMDPAPPPGEPDAVSDVFSTNKAQHMRWNDLQSTDQDAAIALYTSLFGWEQEGAMPMGEMGEYKFVQRNGEAIGAIMRKLPSTPRSTWHFYIGVEDIDRAAEAVAASGGRLAGEIMQIPGGEYAVDVTDPQGALIGLVGPRKA